MVEICKPVTSTRQDGDYVFVFIQKFTLKGKRLLVYLNGGVIALVKKQEFLGAIDEREGDGKFRKL